MQPLLRFDDAAVATITLNRPDRKNALTADLKDALRDALIEVAADASVRAVLLTGSGGAFCVGQDLAEHAAALQAGGPEAAFATVEQHYNPIVTLLSTMPKPVVAAINGACVGAGLGFALACDVRVAADTARFGTAFTGIGLTCDSGLSASLARAVGAARASELVLLAESFDAEQALSWGVVGRVVEAADLAEAVQRLAARLAAGPTLAYAEAKKALRGAWSGDLAAVLAAEGEGQRRLGATRDHQEAVQAFLAKQKPRFTAE